REQPWRAPTRNPAGELTRRVRRGAHAPGSPACSRAGFAEVLTQPVEERRLGGEEPLARLVEPEPGRPVDLRELLRPARARRPFELERVAAHRLRVEVALRRPGPDELATALAHLPQLDQRSLGQLGAGLLGELAPGANQRRLVVAVLALGDRPGAEVLARPERPARMDEQHLRAGG